MAQAFPYIIGDLTLLKFSAWIINFHKKNLQIKREQKFSLDIRHSRCSSFPCLLVAAAAAAALHQSTPVAAYTCAGRHKSRRIHRPPSLCQLRPHTLPALDANSASFAPPLLRPPRSSIRPPLASLCTPPAWIEDTGAPPSSPRPRLHAWWVGGPERRKYGCILCISLLSSRDHVLSLKPPTPPVVSEDRQCPHQQIFEGGRPVWTRTAASATATTAGRRSRPGPPATARERRTA